jgi:tripartite-type tricarboxylate transporter receptor subunit TctC
LDALPPTPEFQQKTAHYPIARTSDFEMPMLCAQVNRLRARCRFASNKRREDEGVLLMASTIAARLSMLLATAALLAACAPTAAPGATPAPAAASTAALALTAAPAKPTATPVPAKEAAKPAVQPTEKPIAKSGAAPVPDERAVADFYRGKTIRIVVGFAPGGTFDASSRIIARHLPKHLPGSPTVIVENKPGAASLLAANLVYNAEPKDGTVIASFNEYSVLRQALGAQGVEFDAGKFNWLGNGNKTFSVCLARNDSGIGAIQDTIGGGKELTVGTVGLGTNSHDGPAVLSAALGARLKLVPGYESVPKVRLAAEAREVDGYCHTFDSLPTTYRELVEGPKASVHVIVALTSQIPDLPFMKGVPTAESLAKTEDAKLMLQTIDAPAKMTRPLAVAPDVPKDRVAALRRSLEQTWRDAEFQAELGKAGLDGVFGTGEEVERLVQEVLRTPPAVLAKLKDVLK